MKKLRHKFSDTMSMAIVAALLAFALSSAAVQYMDLDSWMMYSYARIFLAVLISMPIYLAVFRNWKSLLASVGVIIAIAAVIAIVWRNGGFSETLGAELSDFFKWLYGFIFNWKIGMKMPDPYVYATTLGLSSLITLVMYFFIVKKFIYPPVFLMTAFIFVAQWTVTREVNRFAFYIALAILIILYFMNIYFNRIRKLRRKNEDQAFLKPGKFITAAIPLVAVVLLFTMIIPKSSEPIKWKWLDDRIKYRDVNADKAIDFKSYDLFSLAATGFSSEAGKPGGSVTLDFSHVLDMYGDEIAYLRGESWPYFNGTSWGSLSSLENYSEMVISYKVYNAERQMLLEPVYGWRFMNLNNWLENVLPDYEGERVLPGSDFSSVMGEHLLPGWYDNYSLDLSYVGVETKTIFSPLYSMLTSTEDLPDIFAETDDTFEAEEKIRLNTFLHYDYLSMDRESGELLNLLKRSKQGIYESAYSTLVYLTNNAAAYNNITIANSMQYTLDDLYSLYLKSQINYWRYTALPENLPERVKGLANAITADYDNNYEKIKAIENYFRDGYVYNLTVADVPDDRDFVDWFLFDTKEGYCTYYATAMCTLARSIGVPARYIEGFVTPAVPSGGDRYPILNSNAHAWVEVYFEGIGWMTFEPTPPFAYILDKDSDIDLNLGDELLEDPALEDYLDKLDEYEGLGLAGAAGNTGNGLKAGVIAGISIAALLGLLLIINITAVIARNILFKRINDLKKFKFGYFIILKIISIRGFRLDKGMTLMELSGRLDGAYYMAHVSMKDLTAVYYKIIYDGSSVPVEELRKMEIFYKEFRYEFNNELKLWEWVVYRILIPRI